MLKRTFIFLFGLYTLFLCVATLTPSQFISVGFHIYDKLIHFLSFGLWSGGLLFYSIYFGHKEESITYKWAVLFGSLFGGLIEILQLVLPINRSFEVLDFVADSLGAILISYLILLLIRTLKSSIEVKKSQN